MERPIARLIPLLLAGALTPAYPGPPASVEATLLAALSLRDPLTGAHVRRTGELAAALAPSLGVDPALARRGGRLHDLGKFGMPDRILRNTRATLTSAEYAQVKLHPIDGRQLAEEVGLDPALLPAIASHHERWGGGGYPAGLVGRAIPPLARVVAVADVLDAVTGRRTYKAARSFDEGMAVLREIAGAKLDPRVVAYAEEIAPTLERMISRWQGVTDPGATEKRP